MTSPTHTDGGDAEKEIARLNKVVNALMDRAERSTSAHASDFSQFHTAVILEDQVRGRTAQLEAALRENEQITRALRDSEARFRGLVSQSLVGIVLVDDDRITYSNAKFDEIFGYTSEEVRELSPLDFAVEADRSLVEENLRRRLEGEIDSLEYRFRGARKDGREVDIEAHSSALDTGGKILVISLVMDITERARAEHEVLALQEQLRDESTHDALTGLYNRRYLEESLPRELVRAKREEHPVSLIMGDLDHFKAVNDVHGHQAGDAVLRAFGDLMKRHARESDIYCRYGGEEFLVVLPSMPKQAAAERAEKLRSLIEDSPVAFGHASIPATASFGVASFPLDGRSADELIAAADRALYRAKEAGRNRVSCESLPYT